MPARPQPRRAEHALDTRAALVAAARRLFAAHGYDGTGTEQIVAEARVTRGALYHHFRDKADLFRAAMTEAAAAVAMQLTDEQLAAESASPLADIREGICAFLDVCVGGDFQRIVLVDGPRVLGADAWEDLVERYGRGLLEEWLDRAVSAGDVAPVPTGPLARLLIAMLTEASLAIARADDPLRARAELGEVLDRLLTGLRPLSRPRDISDDRASVSPPVSTALDVMLARRARKEPASSGCEHRSGSGRRSLNAEVDAGCVMTWTGQTYRLPAIRRWRSGWKGLRAGRG